MKKIILKTNKFYLFIIVVLLSIKYPYPFIIVTSTLHVSLWFLIYYFSLNIDYKSNQILNLPLKTHLFFGIIFFILFWLFNNVSGIFQGIFFLLFFAELVLLIVTVYRCHFQNKEYKYFFLLSLFSLFISIWLIPLKNELDKQ